MLCFVKDVQLDPNKIEDAAKELRYSDRLSIKTKQNSHIFDDN